MTASGSRASRGPGWPRVGSIVALTVLAGVLFATAMSWGIGYDEEQYVAGPYFARSLALYREFASIQPPLHTWIVASIFDAVGGWYLLTARVVTWLLACGSCILLFSLLQSFGAGRAMALVLIVGFVASPFAQIPFAMARSDMLPLFLMLAALRCFFDAGGDASASARRLAASGLLATLAFSAKYSYVFAAPALFTALAARAWFAGIDHGGGRPLIAFVAGALAGLSPLAYAYLMSGDLLASLTLRFHLVAVPAWYEAEGIGNMLTLGYKLRHFARLAVQSGDATLLIVLGAAVAVRLATTGLHWRQPAPATLTVLLLLAGALVVAIRVGPYAYYYVGVAAMLALLAGRAYGAIRPRLPRWSIIALTAACLLPSTSALVLDATLARAAIDVDDWTGVVAHRSAERLAGILSAHGLSGHVATLFPSVVIDANVVREEFAAGPFFFRSADTYSDERVRELHAVGPRTLETFLAGSPPAAIVAGFAGFPVEWKQTMDRSLIDYARHHGYELVATDWRVNGYKDGQVWLRRR